MLGFLFGRAPRIAKRGWRLSFGPYVVRHPVSASVCCSRQNSVWVCIPSELMGANVLWSSIHLATRSIIRTAEGRSPPATLLRLNAFTNDSAVPFDSGLATGVLMGV